MPPSLSARLSNSTRWPPSSPREAPFTTPSRSRASWRWRRCAAVSRAAGIIVVTSRTPARPGKSISPSTPAASAARPSPRTSPSARDDKALPILIENDLAPADFEVEFALPLVAPRAGLGGIADAHAHPVEPRRQLDIFGADGGAVR